MLSKAGLCSFEGLTGLVSVKNAVFRMRDFCVMAAAY